MEKVNNNIFHFSLNGVTIIDTPDKNYFILVKPDNGAWITLENEKLPIIKNIIQNGASSEDFKGKYANDKVIFRQLFEKGILNINNKAIVKENWYECQTMSENDFPSEIILKYTKACNLRCSYCYAFSESNKNASMSNDTALYIIEKVVNEFGDNYYNVNLHGGEPLLRYKDMIPLVKAVKKISKKLFFSMQTNGTMITKEIAKFIKEEDIGVGVSLDGVTENTNGLRRDALGQSTFSRSLNGIDLLMSEGLSPGILSVITPDNQYELIEFLDFCIERGVKRFGYNFFIPTGRGTSEAHPLNLDNYIDTTLKLILKLNEANRAVTSREDSIQIREISNVIQNLVSWDRTNKCSQSPCGSGRKLLGFDTDGTIYACDDFINHREFSYGNVFKVDSLKDMIQSSPLTEQMLNHNINNIEECSQCSWKKVCPAHCAADSFFNRGGLNKPHSQCDYYKRLIPLIIELIHYDKINPKLFKW